jgi:hypothetical protein
MTYYILTFHRLKSDATYGPMVGAPLLFDARQTAMDYALAGNRENALAFRINEVVCFTAPTENNS